VVKELIVDFDLATGISTGFKNQSPTVFEVCPIIDGKKTQGISLGFIV
jgi:hypothetical protein